MTFDVVPDVGSKHEVQYFGGSFNDRCLEHTARVSADPGLTKEYEGCRLETLTERNYLVIDDLLPGIVLLQHCQELRDV